MPVGHDKKELGYLIEINNLLKWIKIECGSEKYEILKDLSRNVTIDQKVTYVQKNTKFYYFSGGDSIRNETILEMMDAKQPILHGKRWGFWVIKEERAKSLAKKKSSTCFLLCYYWQIFETYCHLYCLDSMLTSFRRCHQYRKWFHNFVL